MSMNSLRPYRVRQLKDGISGLWASELGQEERGAPESNMES